MRFGWSGLSGVGACGISVPAAVGCIGAFSSAVLGLWGSLAAMPLTGTSTMGVWRSARSLRLTRRALMRMLQPVSAQRRLRAASRRIVQAQRVDIHSPLPWRIDGGADVVHSVAELVEPVGEARPARRGWCFARRRGVGGGGRLAGVDVGGDLLGAGACLGEVVGVFERSGQRASPVVGGGLRLGAFGGDSAVQFGEP